MDEVPAVALVPGFAIVRSGTNRTWLLRLDDELTFGRGHDCDVHIGVDPPDDLVSREAGSLTGLHDGVLIRNTSRTQSIRFRPLPGPEVEIRPGMAIGTMPFSYVRLEVLGRHGVCYALHVDARGMTAERRLDVSRAASRVSRRSLPTRFGPDYKLTGRELRLLAALCEPLLTQAGGRAASYRHVAERLGNAATVNSVRTGLDRLRNRLANEGIPGLRSDADGDVGHDAQHFAQALARWAIDAKQIDDSSAMQLLPARHEVLKHLPADKDPGNRSWSPVQR
ncbi:hypothetical protein [Pseudonocardia charpentierae]|uniref:FHA domain-containing protein n=1 Tax=Pseudonocardia charpentierae TaxID=3075545 RepID=A0ABU2NJS0_9PSEU|nr:hypothetical protein [Pseudonocardia sp. DSM 45834]MDT0353965.1 hypothetical protein [Pseudonocardia sp. DSM 45834]